MNKTNAIKLAGLLAAIAASIAAAAHGDYVSAIGIFSASLASVSAVTGDKE